MIWHRLTRDHGGLLEGSVISDDRFKSISYVDKVFFEPIEDFQIRDMIEYDNSVYCIENGIDKVLFYNEHELDKFLNKNNECSID